MYICRIFEEQGNEKPCIATVLFVFTSDMGREKKPQKTHVPFKDWVIFFYRQLSLEICFYNFSVSHGIFN